MLKSYMFPTRTLSFTALQYIITWASPSFESLLLHGHRYFWQTLKVQIRIGIIILSWGSSTDEWFINLRNIVVKPISIKTMHFVWLIPKTLSESEIRFCIWHRWKFLGIWVNMIYILSHKLHVWASRDTQSKLRDRTFYLEYHQSCWRVSLNSDSSSSLFQGHEIIIDNQSDIWQNKLDHFQFTKMFNSSD